MASWYPSGLPQPILQLVRAIENTFAPLRPQNPVRLPAIAAVDLTAALASRHPYSAAIDSTNGKVVMSKPDGAGAYEWVNADGTAL